MHRPTWTHSWLVFYSFFSGSRFSLSMNPVRNLLVYSVQWNVELDWSRPKNVIETNITSYRVYPSFAPRECSLWKSRPSHLQCLTHSHFGANPFGKWRIISQEKIVVDLWRENVHFQVAAMPTCPFGNIKLSSDKTKPFAGEVSGVFAFCQTVAKHITPSGV